MRRTFLRALRSVKARGAQTRCCHQEFPGRRGRIYGGANAGICFLRILTMLGGGVMDVVIVMDVIDVVIVIIVIIVINVINDFGVIDDFDGEARG